MRIDPGLDERAARWLAPQLAPYELRALDVALAHMARKRTGSAALARLLAWTSAAERQGHACLDLTSEQFDEQMKIEIAAQDWVGDGSAVTPVVMYLDKLYLWRNWQHEQVIAAAFLRRAGAPAQAIGSLHADLDLLYPDPDSRDQRQAVAAALGRRLFVLTGGPGTGKTTTVLRLLMLLQRHAAACALPANCSIALAAPTGKAAARLAQAIRLGKQGAAELLDDSWSGVLQQVPEQAATLHRLLGFHPATDRFARNRRSPLSADVVVVDEASMVDLALMRALVDAMPDSAMLILVGDADQLVSVSAGSVLADIVLAAEHASSSLHGNVSRLGHVWRAAGGLARVYETVRVGDLEQLRAALADADSGCTLQACRDGEQLAHRVGQWLSDPLVAASMLPTAQRDPLTALRLSQEHQLLCATRSGPFGADTVNSQIDSSLRASHGGGSIWYPGRRIIVTENDYGRRLFNGDVGIAQWHQGSLRVCFEALDEHGDPGFRTLLPQELPAHQLAFAITVHKSQGSEYNHIAVILPPDSEHPLLSRQLLYTAVSRARRSVRLWSSADAVIAAMNRLVTRQGGLRASLGQTH